MSRALLPGAAAYLSAKVLALVQGLVVGNVHLSSQELSVLAHIMAAKRH